MAVEDVGVRIVVAQVVAVLRPPEIAVSRVTASITRIIVIKYNFTTKHHLSRMFVYFEDIALAQASAHQLLSFSF